MPIVDTGHPHVCCPEIRPGNPLVTHSTYYTSFFACRYHSLAANVLCDIDFVDLTYSPSLLFPAASNFDALPAWVYDVPQKEHIKCVGRAVPRTASFRQIRRSFPLFMPWSKSPNPINYQGGRLVHISNGINAMTIYRLLALAQQ